MSAKSDGKDKARLSKKFARLYATAVDLQAAASELVGHEVEINLKLEGDSFTATAGPMRFGAKSSGL